MIKNTFKKASVAVLAVATLAACASEVTVEPAEANPTPHDMKQGEGLFSGKSGNLLDGFRARPGESGGVMGSVLVPVNPYLWRASLEAVNFMPIAQTDSTGGTILTDWYVNPNNTSERLKVNIFVLGREFQVQNLKVNIFKQTRSGGEWTAAAADAATSTQLEDTILTNARAMRIQAAQEIQ